MNIFKKLFGRKSDSASSSSILSERLELRTRISRNANPVLFIIEEKVKDLLLTKYKDEFMVSNLETKDVNPDYEVNADIEYKDGIVQERKKGFFRGKKSSSKEILNNRLEIRIKANKGDNVYQRIKQDINDIIYEITEKEANKVVVERDTCKIGSSESIKILISLQ